MHEWPELRHRTQGAEPPKKGEVGPRAQSLRKVKVGPEALGAPGAQSPGRERLGPGGPEPEKGETGAVAQKLRSKVVELGWGGHNHRNGAETKRAKAPTQV